MPDEKTIPSDSLLLDIFREGNIQYIKELMQTLGKKDFYSFKKISSTNTYSDTFNLAIQAGNHSVVKLLIDNWPKDQKKELIPYDWRDITPVSIAIKNGNLPLLKILLKYSDKTPGWIYHNILIRIAAESGKLDIIKYVFETIAPERKIKEDWIDLAVENGHVDILEYFYKLTPSLFRPIFDSHPLFIGDYTLNILNSYCYQMTCCKKDIVKFFYEKELVLPGFFQANSSVFISYFNRVLKSGEVETAEYILSLNKKVKFDEDSFLKGLESGKVEMVDFILSDKIKFNVSWQRPVDLAMTYALKRANIKLLNHLLEKYPELNTIDRHINCARTVVLDENIPLENLHDLILWIKNSKSLMTDKNYLQLYLSALYRTLNSREKQEIVLNNVRLLLSIMPLDSCSQYRRNDYFQELIVDASRRNNDVVYKMIMKVRFFFSYAEQEHTQVGSVQLQNFISSQYSIFEERASDPTSTVVLSKEEAHIAYFMLRHFIRKLDTPPSQEALEKIRFLMNIPIVRSLLHEAIAPSTIKNELLRIAVQDRQNDVVNLLMEVDAVYIQAQQDGFYTTGAHNYLAQIAQDRESSMKALSVEEKLILSRINERYEPIIKYIGEEKAFNQVLIDIGDEYNKAPIEIKLSDRSIKLPLAWTDFKGLKLSPEDEKKALEAYYKHPTHTAYRYLSIPNPWIASNALFVRRDNNGNNYADFEPYKPLITKLWFAAKDDSMHAMGDWTIQTRKEAVINEFALIGRAHNWDTTRIRLVNGKEIKEEFDDLNGDKPSCYSGMNKRLFQALKGHPLYSNIKDIIEQTVSERAREDVQKKIANLSSMEIEQILQSNSRLIAGDIIEEDQTRNITKESIKGYLEDLHKTYDSIYGETEINSFIDELNLLSKSYKIPFDVVHKWLFTEWEKRNDTSRQIFQKDSKEIVIYLKNPNNFISAIHLKLLPDIINKLSKEELSTLFNKLVGNESLNEQLEMALSTVPSDILVTLKEKLSPEYSKKIDDIIQPKLPLAAEPIKTMCEKLVKKLEELEKNDAMNSLIIFLKNNKDADEDTLNKELRTCLINSPEVEERNQIIAAAHQVGLLGDYGHEKEIIKLKFKFEDLPKEQFFSGPLQESEELQEIIQDQARLKDAIIDLEYLKLYLTKSQSSFFNRNKKLRTNLDEKIQLTSNLIINLKVLNENFTDISSPDFSRRMEKSISNTLEIIGKYKAIYEKQASSLESRIMQLVNKIVMKLHAYFYKDAHTLNPVYNKHLDKTTDRCVHFKNRFHKAVPDAESNDVQPKTDQQPRRLE